MTTGSLCLTEILMSRKSCSSNSEHSHSADSTSASGVALPYFASNRLSSEPALTPMRIGTPASFAALAISPTLSSNFLMLPGLTRTAAQPASIAAKTYRGWKWMSAITGICECRAISGSASASSVSGTATRTIWQPVAVSSAICCRVALTSAVFVVVIDCTLTGKSLPTPTPPTFSCRVLRRGASTGGGAAGMPSSTGIAMATSIARCTEQCRERACELRGRSADGDRVDDVGDHQQRREHQEDPGDGVGDRHQPRDVERTGVGPPAHPRDPGTGPLVQRPGDVPAVERVDRQQVEQEQHQVDRGQQAQEQAELLQTGEVVLGEHLAGDPPDADDADRTVRVALLAQEGRPEHLRDPLGDLHQLLHRLGDDHPEVAGHVADGLPREPGGGADSKEAGGLGLVAAGLDVDGVLDRGDGHVAAVAVPLDGDDDGRAGRAADLGLHRRPAVERIGVEGLAADRDDRVAGA